MPDSQFSVKTVAESHELAQTLPQAPQLSTLPVRSCSQPLAALPSQSAEPARAGRRAADAAGADPRGVGQAAGGPVRRGGVWQPLTRIADADRAGPGAAAQTGAAPGVQTPAWQVSAPLQALPSEQEVPSGQRRHAARAGRGIAHAGDVAGVGRARSWRRCPGRSRRPAAAASRGRGSRAPADRSR